MVYFQARLEDDAQCILVIIGATPKGKEELYRACRWRARERAVMEGAVARPEAARPRCCTRARHCRRRAGFWKALGEVWGKTREQP
jgi:putative transposase